MKDNIEVKLTSNKSNQINMNDNFESKNSQRQTIKIRSKNRLFLTEGQNSIKYTKSINNIKFPKIKNDIIYNLKHSPKRLSININNSFMHNYHTIDQSHSNKKFNEIKNPDYIKLNSLFSFPQLSNKRNFSNKINYSNSIDIPNNGRLLLNKKIDKLKINDIPKKKYSKIYPLNLNTKKSQEKDELYEIYNFMKMKYYVDTEAKMEKLLKDDSFIDQRDKEKLIQIGKFHVFWKNVVDYCGGFIFSQKIKDIKKLKNFELGNSLEENKNKIKLKKMPNNRIYTNILRAKLIHYNKNL